MYIDGVSQGSRSSYAPETRWQTARTWSVPYGSHSIEVRGNGNGTSDLDAFVVDIVYALPGSYDNTSSKVKHIGNWIRDTAYSGGAYGGTTSYTDVKENAITFTFNGDAVTWVRDTAYNRGYATVTIDGVNYGLYDQYSSAIQWQQSKTFSGLGPGIHTISISASGQKNDASSGYNVSVDRFIVQAATVGGTTYPPIGQFNGNLVYLSPSSQSGNIGCDNYVESEGARNIAVAAKDKLVSWGYVVRIGNGDYQQNTADSNDWKSTVHVPIHSNARAERDCVAPFPPETLPLGGTWLMYEPGDAKDIKLSEFIYPELSGFSPGTKDKINTDDALTGAPLGELRNTTMPAAYVEAAYHTFRPDVDWLRGSANVGAKIAQGIDKYFGSPRCGVNRQCPEYVEPDVAAAGTRTALPVVPDTSDYVGSERRAFPQLRAALEQLLAGPRSNEATQGGASIFSEATAGMVNDVAITPDGVVIVDFADFSNIIPNASTSAGRAGLFTELNTAVFQFANVNSVIYQFDTSCGGFYYWLESTCQPISRADWEAYLAASQN